MRNDYGIGPALTAAMQMLSHASRGTGRTTHMIECLRDGDRVIFCDHNEAERVRRIARQRKIKIETIVCEPTERGLLTRVEPYPGVTHFDHSWVDRYFVTAVAHARSSLESMQGTVSREPSQIDFRGNFEAYR